jgi:RNA polymerase sigma factor (sigma-70 family)
MLARRHPLMPVAADYLDTADETMPDRHTRLVAAAQAGDASALETLVAEHLPLLYSVVGRALNGHCDVDDVVQETLLRLVRGLGALREPASFRPWLLSIAIRQVGVCRHRRRAAGQQYMLDDATEVADPAAEVQNVAVLRLQLAEQLRHLVRASRWLDRDHRRLLRLWSRQVTGTLRRAELADRVGISVAHAGVRLQRMQQQLTLCRVITAALANQPPCHLLSEAVAGWNGDTTSVWRKRIGRHVRDCADCSSCGSELIPADRLLLACATWLPPAVAPADDAERVSSTDREPVQSRWFLPPLHGMRPVRSYEANAFLTGAGLTGHT